ncbi:MAG TPA: D-glycero-beta-D-manno-heptose-1,7-bisphosphate 7-phosphatase [Firmicutes bacterium]|jgi:D-glycero-D-manno-heptose 1,7-bisphosphate phosphatase|nr:D-glycero-beta-D-manno-heptose-1,7-bisphosphate 7-phosphatase [Bacillota bacterium]
MTQRKRAVFLDRDGVLNQSIGSRPPNNEEELTLYPGVPKAVAMLNDAGFLVFVVTNQGGVGLGYMTPQDLEGIHQKLAEEVGKHGGSFTEIMACTHRPRAGCSCRKPKPGMLLTLAEKHHIDLENSFMVGDRDMDIEAGRAAGTTTIWIESDKKTEQVADYTCPNLLAASELILSLT